MRAIATRQGQPEVRVNKTVSGEKSRTTDLILFRLLPVGKDLNNRALGWEMDARRLCLPVRITPIVREHGARV